jgi:hypothetical protein
MRKIITFIRRLFRRDSIVIDMAAATLPEAFQYPEPAYNILVNELVNALDEEDRFQSFAKYLKTKDFQKYQLDIEQPRDALIVGYAFASAVMLKSNIAMQHRATQVLEKFYPSDKVTN